MDGWYILPLGITPKQRTSAGAIRRLWLRPSGISSWDVFQDIIKGMMKRSTEGFVVKDGDGEAVVIMDPVAYLGEYTVVTEVIDVMGHTGPVPRDLCIF